MDLINQANSAVTSFFNSSEAFTKNQSSKTNTVQSEAVSSVTHLYYDWGWVIVLHRKEMMSPFSCDVCTFFFSAKKGWEIIPLNDSGAFFVFGEQQLTSLVSPLRELMLHKAESHLLSLGFLTIPSFIHTQTIQYLLLPVTWCTSHLAQLGEKTEGWLTASKWLEAKM